ncbi:MAG: DUF262 domain-containing protein [Patescibacteria group bacterium]|jgi:uncharacterized protein with ParB-like and HNH nuclease domain
MQDYIRESINNIIESVNDKIYLPDIQRSFVWKPIQVYTLFDSLLRDYPISTFLFWKLKGNYLENEKIKKLKFVNQSNEDNVTDTSINTEKEYLLVLDGQQRITTFYLVLKGNYILRNKKYDLYFNILSGDEENEDDGILYEFNFYNSDKGEKFVEKDKNEVIEKAWYRVKNIYSIKDIEDVSDIVTTKFEAEYSIVVSKEQKKAVSKLLRMLRYESIIYYYPETEENYDKVLDIFVRTNSGGTKLSYSDLLFSTIKSKWSEAREKFKELNTNLNDNDRFGFSNDFVLKTILFINANDINGLKYKTKNFNIDLIEVIKDDVYWKKLTSTIYLARDILNDKFHLTHKNLISSNNAVIPLIYWLFKHGKKAIGSENNCVSEDDILKMRTWFVKALLSGVFGGQSDTILMKCKNSIDVVAEDFPALAIETKIQKETKKLMEITTDDIDKISYNSNNSYLVLSLIYKHSINFQPSLRANIPEQDHIFSQDELKQKGIAENEINTIYNIRYVGKGPNQSKSNKPYAEWIKTQLSIDKQMHLIPITNNWTVDSYSDFIEERKKLILTTLNYLQK